MEGYFCHFATLKSCGLESLHFLLLKIMGPAWLILMGFFQIKKT